MGRYFLFFLVAVSSLYASDIMNYDTPSMAIVPVAYKGRFRPMEAYAKLWLYDIYHSQKIKSPHRELFLTPSGSAIDVLWNLQLHREGNWEKTPLFWIHYASVKKMLGLNLTQDRFSYAELQQAINPQFLTQLVQYQFVKEYRNPANRAHSKKIELSSLHPDLWVVLHDNQLEIAKTPKEGFFSQLKPATRFPFIAAEKEIKLQAEEGLTLLFQMRQFENLNQGELLKVLPSRFGNGEWVSISQLEKSSKNFTLYSDDLFEKLKNTYKNLKEGMDNKKSVELADQLSLLLIEGYKQIEGKPYQSAAGKALYYPSLLRLKAEAAYYHYPIIEITILGYLIALFLNLFGLTRISLWAMIITFGFHTLLLSMRCYILGRPPVSNMFETVIYVPWIAVLVSFILYFIIKARIVLPLASLLAVGLLVLLEVTDMSSSMENVQAVLDSQYWLIIHVLMVVGSYGVFALAGMLGQLYLIQAFLNKRETPTMASLAKAMLQALYLGVALLIPGTILGGIWAAESWGRFWDWDPKESWAFISSCIYIIFIHAYTFHHIGNFGLAIGSLIGFLAISFTWYGVNYILGTGLHSYGFGSGGEAFYYLFVVAEVIFIGASWFMNSQKRKVSN